MLPLDEARERVRNLIEPLSPETVPLEQAARRYSATDIHAPISLPRWDNSAMDGFAVRSREIPATLPVTTTIAAGDSPGFELERGTTCKVMTGAPIPGGADAVVMREDVQCEGDRAVFTDATSPGTHVRRSGEDIARGDIVVHAGAALLPGEIAALAALGIAAVDVRRRPKVAILASGNELVRLGTEPKPGQKPNSSAYALAAAIELAGGEVVSDVIAEDTEEAVRQAMTEALEQCDVLLTTGGVSVGDFDFVRKVAPSVGIEVDFWKVAIKPGKPLVVGRGPKGQLYFGLPGNPVSTLVVYELFVRPSLLALAGAARCQRPRAQVELSARYPKKPGRAHFVPATIRREGSRWIADTSRKQGSGTMSSMIGVDGLVEFPAQTADVEAGATASALLLDFA